MGRAVDAHELAEGGHMSGTGLGEAGCEEDDAESPPCKGPKLFLFTKHCPIMKFMQLPICAL